MSQGLDQVAGGAHALLSEPPRIVNVGLELFARELASQGARVVHVRWSPPAGGNPQLAALLDKLRG
jgi:FdrA protein